MLAEVPTGHIIKKKEQKGAVGILFPERFLSALIFSSILKRCYQYVTSSHRQALSPQQYRRHGG